jgi:lysyl-tRNA synthetase class 2
MEPENHLVKERINKLAKIRALGVNPYPSRFERTHSSSDIKKEFEKLNKEEDSGKEVGIAGRIITTRSMGKASFFNVQDESGQIQVYIREDEAGNAYAVFRECDNGDFVGIKGGVFRTKTGELTIRVKSFELLSKSLRPLPEKYHGLKDMELKYRKRYLDLISSPESKEVFVKRSRMLKAIRDFLAQRGFMEVETPALHPIYGGAAAKPFVTHHNELDMKLYLRISPELYLKRLLVGGFEKIYDINKNFRNEGIDTTHNPEFTMMEIYQSYADYDDMMKLTEELYEFIAKTVLGTTKIQFKGALIDVKAPWERVKMLDAIQEYAGVDARNMSAEQLLEIVKKNGIEMKNEPNWGNLVCAIFEHFCEKEFVNPTFVIDHPAESTPLCKQTKYDSRLVERFEPFSMGMELANGYSELNDPLLQRRLLEAQQKQLTAGNEEANPLDEDFIEAIEQGMPPAGGVGIGIDRMIMLILGKESIRDIILFPTMKIVQ